MAIRQRAYLVTSGISISTLEIRQERTSRFYLRVEWTSAFKGFDYRCCRMRLFRHCCMSSCTREVVKVLSARFLFELDINVFITLSMYGEKDFSMQSETVRGQSYCLKFFFSLCVQEFWFGFDTSCACGSDWLNGFKKVRSLDLAWLLVPFTNSNKNIQQGTAKFVYVWYKGNVFLKAIRPAPWNTGKQERII